MREELKKRAGVRGGYTATLKRFGEKKAYKGPPIRTALLVDVRDENGNLMTDHLWFTVGLQMARLELQPGDQVGFEARVSQYVKGYRGRRDDEWDDERPPVETDYRLSFPTKFRLVGRSAHTLPLFAGVAAQESSLNG